MDSTFATNPNVPTTGFDLDRFSKRDKGIQCEACHGSTHAVYPSSHGNDNLQNQALQGHEGTLSRCDACHKEMPGDFHKGPPGMHPLGAKGLVKHEDAAEANLASCQACHGKDYRGTVLSRSVLDQTLSTGKYGNNKLFRGAIISRYTCHLGPNNEKVNPNRPAITSPRKMTVGSKPVPIKLQATDPDKVIVTRLADSRKYGGGYPGKGGAIPGLKILSPPVLGSVFKLGVDNSSGAASAFVMLLSGGAADISTPFGGQILVIPTVQLGLPMPATGTQIAWKIPTQSTLLGSGLRLQAVQYDGAARFLFSFNPGLELRIGR